jgi:hypothetical protein
MLNPPRQAVTIAHPAVHPIADADDTYLVGSVSAVAAAFPTPVHPSAANCLLPSLRKSAACGTPATPTCASAHGQRSSSIWRPSMPPTDVLLQVPYTYH